VGKSLKEALLEQLDTLRERGLAPNQVPVEEEAPAVVYDAQAALDSGETRGRQTRRPRVKGPAARPGGQRPMVSAGGFPRNGSDRDRDEREDRGPRPSRPERRPASPAQSFQSARPEGRPDGRPPREFSGPPREFGGPPREFNGPPRDFGGPPRDFGPPRQFGQAPAGQGQFGPPNQFGGPGRSEMLQQRAEQRKREGEQREEVRAAVEAIRGGPVDEEALTAFLGELTVEVGALPGLNIVIEALRAAESDDIRKVGDGIRAYFRRPRAPAPAAPEPVAAPA
jgi:hypothetical protein